MKNRLLEVVSNNICVEYLGRGFFKGDRLSVTPKVAARLLVQYGAALQDVGESELAVEEQKQVAQDVPQTQPKTTDNKSMEGKVSRRWRK